VILYPGTKIAKYKRVQQIYALINFKTYASEIGTIIQYFLGIGPDKLSGNRKEVVIIPPVRPMVTAAQYKFPSAFQPPG
jgi:hypothetical protein